MMYKKGMIFGTFDILHRGHLHYIDAALQNCQKVICGVFSDKFLETKNKFPYNHIYDRIRLIKRITKIHKSFIIDDIIEAVNKHKPNAIFVGIDVNLTDEELIIKTGKVVFRCEQLNKSKYSSSVIRNSNY